MKFYRTIESLLKKINNINKNTKKNELKKAFRSANYYSSQEKEYLFSNHKEINYILKHNDAISRQIYLNDELDFPLIKRVFKLLKWKKKKFIINIGAHVGTTLIPAIKYKLFERAIVFEPSKDNYRLLVANLHINKIEDKVKLFNIALSNIASTGYLKKFHPNNSGDFRVVKKSKNVEKIKLDILDNFTSEINKKNSLILIDADGHEPEIFLGGLKTLRKKIPIIFELDWKHMCKNKKFFPLYNSLKHYRYLVDLEENNRIQKMNEKNFYKIYEHFLKIKSYTNLLIF